ncbi:MAG: TIGR03790 family protein [Rubrivivax sp.]|nr:MAG: TIGR03790 family protein [Rubrivivax sp.]
MKKSFSRNSVQTVLVLGLAIALWPALGVKAAVPSLAAEFANDKGAGAADPALARKWSLGGRLYGHLTAKDVGVVINTDDPYSVQVGEYYAKARGIDASRVLRLSLPIKSNLTPGEFEAFKKQIDDFFGAKTQGLALTWRLPYGVECNSITGALALGYDAKVCANSCMATRASPYFGSMSTKPFTDHGMRLSMLLAAKDVESAKALIDRGVKSDGTLGRRGAPAVNAHFVTTSDAVRSVRSALFPPAGRNPTMGVDFYLDQTDALKNASRVVLYQTGRAQVDFLDTNDFVPGALGDHLTSFGGILDKPHGQMTVLSWIDAGVTASYGTTSEPCAHPQKFPHPQALMGFYLQGATALEAYWKSVAWPQQGLFVGEPLASPFAR